MGLMYYRPLDGSDPLPIAVGAQGPEGPEGPEGPQGPQGDATQEYVDQQDALIKGYVDTRIQSGVAHTGGTSGEVAITFPVPFAVPPVVTVSGTTALALDAAQVGACIVENSITVNGFTARAYVASSGETTAAWALLWIAVGPVAAAQVLPEEG